jgi:type IV secretion system protein VirD4
MTRAGTRTPSELGRSHARIGSGRAVTVLAVIAVVLVALLAWHLALAVTGGPPATHLGATVRALIAGDPIGRLPRGQRPGQPVLTVVLAGLLAVVPLGGWVWWSLRRTGRRSPVGLADRGQTRRSAGEVRAREKAAYGRRGSVDAGDLDVDTAPLADVGLLLGRAAGSGEPVVASLEDQIAVIAPTGGGKTLYLMLGASLDAPGPLVATSTKPEVLDAIVEARTGRGRVWVFDPLNTANWPEPMVWNPVAGAAVSEVASSRGEAFAAGLTGDSGGEQAFFRDAAAIIMARLLHAAALSPGHTMVDVVQWALELERSTTARDILRITSGAELLWAQTLEAASEGADETIASVRMTLGQKVEPILSRKVMRQMTPQRGVEEFDPAAFVTSTDTLILITDDNARTNVAPLTTMLLAEVMDAAKAAAARSMIGRLDPPMRIVGDEIANVAPVPKLPGYLSDSRGSGIQWIVVQNSSGTSTRHSSSAGCRTTTPSSGSPPSSAKPTSSRSPPPSTKRPPPPHDPCHSPNGTCSAPKRSGRSPTARPWSSTATPPPWS